MKDQKIILAVQNCLQALQIDQGSPPPPKIDIFANLDDVLKEIESIRCRALDMIFSARSIVAEISAKSGFEVSAEDFIKAVQSAVVERLFVIGLPIHGAVLTMEELETQVILDPERDYDQFLDSLINESLELGNFSLEIIPVLKLTEILNLNLDDDLGFSRERFNLVKGIIFIVSGNIESPYKENRIFRMINALGLSEDRQVTPEEAEKLRRILILNKKLGERKKAK